MERSDFFKTLGALVISPLTVKGILTDNGCTNNRQQTDFSAAKLIADEDLKARTQYPLTYDECFNYTSLKTSQYR